MNSQDELHRALLLADARFDETLGLLRGEVGPTRYHTLLEPGFPVHPTRESMIYAAALLESGTPWRRERAIRILKLLLTLQDSVAGSATCGIWPWYFEEPLDQMAPPDWNWADFLGVQLVRILQNGRVPEECRPAIEQSLHLAADAIRKRNVRLSYTNIAIMGTYVCVMAGRILDDADMLAYGRGRLKNFVEFTREAGGFPEYNSPTYTVVSLVELTRMARDLPDEDDRALVGEIHDMAWRDIALHWHAPSCRWAGPHSRSYSTLLQPETMGFIQRGLAGKVRLPESDPPPSLDWCGLPIQCPAGLVEIFAERRPRFHHTEVISHGDPPIEGHVHHEPEYVLSSAERGTFWNQSRPLVAYAPSKHGPVALAVRFLHDGYDFCAANLLTRQQGSRVLAAVCFARDGGDKHGELDRFPDGRIAGEDWRLRFELINGQEPPRLSLTEPWEIPFGDFAILSLHWLHGEFGGGHPRLEVRGTNQGFDLDVIFYHGARREFHFNTDFAANLAFALALRARGAPDSSIGPPECVFHKHELELYWTDNLRLAGPRFPLSETEILAFARSSKSKLAATGSPKLYK